MHCIVQAQYGRVLQRMCSTQALTTLSPVIVNVDLLVSANTQGARAALAVE